MDKKWYVLYVRYRSEMTVKKILESKGIEAMVPIENRLIRRGRKWTKEPYVIFPSYVFVHIRFDINIYRRIMQTRPVYKMLGTYSSDEEDEEDEEPTAADRKNQLLQRLIVEPAPLTEQEEKILIKESKILSEPPVIRLCEDGSCEVLTKGLKRMKILKIDQHARRITFSMTIAGTETKFTMSFIKADEQFEQTLNDNSG